MLLVTFCLCSCAFIVSPNTRFCTAALLLTYYTSRLLTQSLDNLQAELDNKSKMYEDRIDTFVKEAAEKDARIIDLETKLQAANEKIAQLESQISELTSKLEGERSVTANLSRKFESEIESLKSKLAARVGPRQEEESSSSVRSSQSDNYLSVIEMKGALRRSKQAEVSLINQNMLMKQKLQDLQRQAEERAAAVNAMMTSVDVVNSEDDGTTEKSAKRRRFRPREIVGNAWRKISRRKKV